MDWKRNPRDRGSTERCWAWHGERGCYLLLEATRAQNSATEFWEEEQGLGTREATHLHQEQSFTSNRRRSLSIVFLKESQGEGDSVLICSAERYPARTQKMDTAAQGRGALFWET